MKDTSKIPFGPYCYTYDDKGKYIKCPYWGIDESHIPQDNGYCSYMEKGDWDDDSWSLLWDQIKECGINQDESEN